MARVIGAWVIAACSFRRAAATMRRTSQVGARAGGLSCRVTRDRAEPAARAAALDIERFGRWRRTTRDGGGSRRDHRAGGLACAGRKRCRERKRKHRGRGRRGRRRPTARAGATEVSDACASDTDCVMCTAQLGPEENCCRGCPTPHSKQRCDAENIAAKMCLAAKRPAPPIPVCPALLCVEPGDAVCINGMCARGDGTR